MILGGPDYTIQGHVLKIYLLICILLDISERFLQFFHLSPLEEVKHLSQPDMLKCAVCGSPLGDWYDEFSWTEFPYHLKSLVLKPNQNTFKAHYVCKYPTDKNGVLI